MMVGALGFIVKESTDGLEPIAGTGPLLPMRALLYFLK